MENDATAGRGSFYDQVWQQWSELDRLSPAAFHRRRLLVKWAVELPTLPQRILDAGCGTGELLLLLRQRFPTALVVGADLSCRSLELARSRVPDCQLFQLDLERRPEATLPLRALGPYDLIVCSEVLEHLRDDLLGTRYLAGLLAPAGRLLLTVPGGRMSRFDQRIGHRRHYSPGRLRSLLEQAGLRVERVVAWGFPFHNLYRTMVRAVARYYFPHYCGGSRSSECSARPEPLLVHGYAWCSRILLPLYYLNWSGWGEQLLGMARAPGQPDPS